MADDIDEAKRSIVEVQPTDPDLDGALKDATEFRHRAQLAALRHKERKVQLEQGLWGVLGAKDYAPNNIAFIAVVCGFLGFGGCLLIAHTHPGDSVEFWGRYAERSLAVGAAALAYIFGRGSSDSKG